MGNPGFWQAWVYLFVTAAASAAIVAYLQRKDPTLLRRWTRGPGAEKNAGQNLLQLLAMLVFSGTLVLSWFDHRSSWSHVSVVVLIAGVALFGVVFFFFFF